MHLFTTGYCSKQFRLIFRILWNLIKSCSLRSNPVKICEILSNSIEFCQFLSNFVQCFPVLSKSVCLNVYFLIQFQNCSVLSDYVQFYPILSNTSNHLHFILNLFSPVQLFMTVFNILVFHRASSTSRNQNRNFLLILS